MGNRLRWFWDWSAAIVCGTMLLVMSLQYQIHAQTVRSWEGALEAWQRSLAGLEPTDPNYYWLREKLQYDIATIEARLRGEGRRLRGEP